MLSMRSEAELNAAHRRTQTLAAFSATEQKFVDLDKLILQFGKTAAGRTLIGDWNAARVIKDTGHTGDGTLPPSGGGTPPPPNP